MSLANIVRRSWDAVGTGNFDTLVADYVEGITFFMPRQEGDRYWGEPYGPPLDFNLYGSNSLQLAALAMEIKETEDRIEHEKRALYFGLSSVCCFLSSIFRYPAACSGVVHFRSK